MDAEKAIEVIKKNYPDSRYTMLREALDLSIKLLEEDAKKEKWYSDGLDYKRS